MNIQIISAHEKSVPRSTAVIYSQIDLPKSLDEFDINIIDLSSADLWKYTGDTILGINQINDFKSISNMISRKSLSKILIVLPPNVRFYYDYSKQAAKYRGSRPLKDMLDTLSNRILAYLLPANMTWPVIQFENTRTTLGSYTYIADFYFEHPQNVVASSHRSKKPTVVEIESDSVYATTLDIFQSEEMLLGFLKHIFPTGTKDDTPGWVEDFLFADDNEQLEIVSKCKEEIAVANEQIKEAEDTLERNLQYKSILFTNGNELVQIVFKILEQILSYDLSGFVDEKREDFLIVKDEFTIIGEIKGVTSNVKNEHISQVDVHYQSYMDRLNEEGKSENVHQILIINPFRTKPINEREPVNEKQIKLAERNGCLIIETITLLKIFEKFLLGQISSQQCINIFLGTTGLLTEPSFNFEDNSLDT